MTNFFVWMLWAVAVFLLVGIVALLFGVAAFPTEVKSILGNLLPIGRRNSPKR